MHLHVAEQYSQKINNLRQTYFCLFYGNSFKISTLLIRELETCAFLPISTSGICNALQNKNICIYRNTNLEYKNFNKNTTKILLWKK
jgi:hypothetical protein